MILYIHISRDSNVKKNTCVQPNIDAQVRQIHESKCIFLHQNYHKIIIILHIATALCTLTSFGQQHNMPFTNYLWLRYLA